MADSVIYGIDLGTTFSAIAYVNSHEEPIVVPLGEKGELTISSTVLFLPDRQVYVGEEAVRNSWMEGSKFVECAKRYIGLKNGLKWSYDGWTYKPEDISALVLRKIKQRTTNDRSLEPAREVVITHPQNFYMNQKEATKLAGDLAGLKTIATLTEPQAAAIAYGLKERAATERKDITVLVFDLGGGTFDVTLMKVGLSQFEMIGSEGNSRLGGMDWDEQIERVVKDNFRLANFQEFEDVANDEQRVKLRKEAMRAKEELSKKAQHRFLIEGGDQKLIVAITQSEFETWTKYLVELCIKRCERLFEITGYRWSEIDQVLMVGSSTKMPMVQKAVEAISGKAPIVDKDPKLMVSKGAAIWAHWVKNGLVDPRWVETEDQEASGLEVREAPGVSGRTAHGLGVLARRETDGRDIVSILIQQNTSTPHTAEQTFFTTKDNATSILVPLYEGESEEPDSAYLMKQIRIDGLPPRPAGSPVKVKFNIDISGRMEVEVVEVGTKHSHKERVEKNFLKSAVSDEDYSFNDRLRHLDELTIL
jgi:molecular chaperone DnaK